MSVEKIDKDIGLEEFCRIVNETAKEMGINIEESGNAYSLVRQSEDIHEWGYGGHRSYRAILKNPEGQSVLETYDYVSWATTSDDFFDYDGPREEHTILFLDDLLARRAFEKIKAMVKK